MCRIAAVTTFHAGHLEMYARRMVETFDARWPRDVSLLVYATGVPPELCTERVRVNPTEDRASLKFREEHRNLRLSRAAPDYDYRRDVLRFHHKPFAIRRAATEAGADYLIWLDADTITHSPVDEDALRMMCAPDADVTYLPRPHKYSECGFLSFNLRARGRAQIERWVNLYQSDGFRECREWHDSYLFDVALERRARDERVRSLSPAGGKKQGAGHPFINGPLGLYMDHLKGDRKRKGRSPKAERRAPTSHPYWN